MWLPFVSFGDVARNQCGMQCQYAARYIDELAPDLRFIGDIKDYHSILIHEDDVKEFFDKYPKKPKEMPKITFSKAKQ
jgi:hypothetical protein